MLEFAFDIRIVLDVGTAVAPTGAATATPTRSGLSANAFANSLGFVDQVIEEIAHVDRYPVDHREDLFEHVSDEIRGGDAKILGEFPDILGKLLRDPSMQDPLFARLVRVATASVGMTRIEALFFHESHCDTS